MKISRYCDYIIIGLLLATVFAVTIFFDIRLYSVFDLGKVICIVLPGLSIMAVWMVKIIFNWKFDFPDTQLNIPVLAYLFITIIAVIFSLNPYTSLMGGYKRFEGLIETSTYIFLFFAFVRFINTSPKLNIAIHTLVISAVVASIYGFMQFFGKDMFKWSTTNPERIFSSFGNPVFFSAFLITILPTSLVLYLGYLAPASKVKGVPFKHRRLALDVIYGICTLIIYVMFWHTKTRACFVGLLCLLPLFLIFLGRKRLYAYRWKLGIMMVLFVAIGAYYSLRPSSSVFTYFANEITFDEKEGGDVSVPVGSIEDEKPNDRSFLAEKLSGSTFNRYYQFKTGLRIFNDYPFLGVGPDALGMVYQKYLAKVFTKRKEDGPWPRHDRIHNDLLDNVVARGGIGLVTYIWLVLAYFWLVWKFIQYRRKTEDADNKGVLNDVIKNVPSVKSITGRVSYLIDTRLLVVGLGSGITGYIVQNEFSFGNTPIVTIFWTVVALTVVVIRDSGFCKRVSMVSTSNSKFFLRKILLSVLAVSFITFVSVHIWNWYKADMKMEYGRRLIMGGDLENGYRAYAEGINLNPLEVNYLDMQTGLFFQISQQTKQKEWLSQVIKASNEKFKVMPDHYLAYYGIGNANFLLSQDYGEDRLDVAIEQYKKAIEEDPFQSDFYNYLALSYIKKERYEESIHVMKKAINCSQNDPEYLERLFRIYLFLNKEDELKKLYSEVVSNSNLKAQFLYVIGTYLAKTGQYEKAYIEFSKAFEKDPDQVEGVENFVSLFDYIGNKADRIKYIKQLIKLKPSNVDYRTKLVNTYLELSFYKEAIVVLEEIMRLDPYKQKYCLDTIGRIYMTQSDLVNAESCFIKAVELEPSNPEFHNNLGTIYAQQNVYGKALLEINTAIELAPDNSTYLDNLAKIYIVQEKWSEAEDVVNRSLQLNADNKEAIDLLKQIKDNK